MLTDYIAKMDSLVSLRMQIDSIGGCVGECLCLGAGGGGCAICWLVRAGWLAAVRRQVLIRC